MNVLFVGKRTNDSSSGIEKKMMGQIKALEKLGHHVYYTFFEKGCVYLSTVDGKKEEVASYQQNIFSMYLANESAIKAVLKQKPGFFQLFYMRKGLTSWFHLDNLKELKKQGVKVIEEIPTYPYDKELLKTPGWSLKVYYVIDRLFRPGLKKYVDFIVTYSEDKEIFGIPAIPVNNGIDMQDIPSCNEEKTDHVLHLITVSAMYYWHGYERLIKGLAEYYRNGDEGKENILVDMVGDGPCRKEWEQLVGDNHLQEHVRFRGQRSGKELDEIFAGADLAVASLALYKKDLEKASELKVREYCARGIPFVLGCEDMGFTGTERFAFWVPNDDSPVEIEKIVTFYHSLGDRKQLIHEIREFAGEHFAWEVQLNKVMKRLDNTKR